MIFNQDESGSSSIKNLFEGKDEFGYINPIIISEIDSKEVFDVIVRMRRKKFMKLYINPLFLDVISDRVLSNQGLYVLSVLAQNIGYNSMVYTTVEDIVKETELPRYKVSLAISELKEKGFLREPSNRLLEKNARFLILNPVYFFLGYYSQREGLLRDWVMGRNGL